MILTGHLLGANVLTEDKDKRTLAKTSPNKSLQA